MFNWHHSEEAKVKIWLASKWRKMSQETKDKIGKANSGKTMSLEQRKKISDSKKWKQTWLGKKHSEATKKKMSERMKNNPLKYWLWKKRDPLTTKKIVESRKWYKASEETRIKQSVSMKKTLNTNSKKTKYLENQSIRWWIDIKLWRESVFKRDDWTCQKCKNKWLKLNAHHILNFSSHEELRFAIDNWITFCKDCHKEFHNINWRRDNTKEQVAIYIWYEPNGKDIKFMVENEKYYEE